MSTNRFGLDVSYHSHYLNHLVMGIDNYTPFEYARALLRMVKLVAPKVMNEPEFCKNKVDPNEQSDTELTGEYHADCNKLIKDLANEQSKIERIRAEIESLSVKPRVIDDPEPEAEIINDTIFGALQIIDIVSNESDITDNGSD